MLSELGRNFDRAMEIGCAQGAMTERLAPLCKELLAVDFVSVAIERARGRHHGSAISFALWDLKADPVPGQFDLIVIIDVLGSCSGRRDVRRASDKLVAALTPGGYVLYGDVIGDSLTRRIHDSWLGRLLLFRPGKILRIFAAHPALVQVACRNTEMHLLALLQKRAAMDPQPVGYRPRSAGSMKEKLINAGLFIGTMILCLLALEIGLRAYHGEWEFTNFRYPQANKFTGYHTYDAELGWVPEQQQATVWGKTVTILKDGIRSNGGGEVRDGTEDPILAVGDSYTFGDQVADSETWPAQLDQLSGKRVVNGGVDGYGVDQIFLRAQRLLNRYRFSTVIFSFIPDDLRRAEMSVMFATAKPYFDFKGGQLTLENVPVPPPSILPQKESPLLIAVEHSRLVDAVMKRVSPKWWLRGASETQVQDQEQVIKVTCVLLQKLGELAKSRGSELIVLAQHWEFEPASESTESERVLHCLSDPATRVLDLKPALSALKARDPARYHQLYNPFLHMSAEGNQFVARELLPVLAER